MTRKACLFLPFLCALLLDGCSDSSPAPQHFARAPEGTLRLSEAQARTGSTLKAHMLGPSDAERVVLLLHGFGARGDDLLPLARNLSASTPYQYVVVEAPLVRAEGGRAWWPIDFAAQRKRFDRGHGLDLRGEDPEALPAAREELVRLIEDLQAKTPNKPRIIAALGFSQGAMLSLDLALHAPSSIGCVGFLSGSFLRESIWRERLAQPRNLSVFMSHGTEDTILPFALSEELRDALTQHGVHVTFVPFAGGHGIPQAVVAQLKTFLERCLHP